LDAVSDREEENPSRPILPVLVADPTLEDGVATRVRAFMARDYDCFWIMVEELGAVRVIETHHDICGHQDKEGGGARRPRRRGGTDDVGARSRRLREARPIVLDES
jgi:hypothetical protein